MRQAPRHRVADSACSRVGRAAQTAATFLSVLCLFVILVFTAFVPASLEERIGYLFLFGLIPALGCYLIGHILRGVLALSCKLCGIIAPHCLKWQARFTNSLLNWASASVLDLSDRCSLTLAHCRLATGRWMRILYRLAQKERRSVNRQYRYVRGAIVEFSCLPIRKAARFVITLQQSVDRSTKQALCLSFDDMTLLISRNMQCKQQPRVRRPQPARSMAQPATDEASLERFLSGRCRSAAATSISRRSGGPRPAQGHGELVADTRGQGQRIWQRQNWQAAEVGSGRSETVARR